MIILNGDRIEQNHFPDQTLLVKAPGYSDGVKVLNLVWHYENDAELFTVICLRKHYKPIPMTLTMPYIPHARMDRVKGYDDVFTLKYFTEVINKLHFKEVIVLDPHSDVSTALLNNVKVERPGHYIHKAIDKMFYAETNQVGHEYRIPFMNDMVMFYPDEGSMKRYSGMINHPYAFGIKNRDWETGKILGLDIMNKEIVKGKNVLIVDDICSKGGTFFHSAKALKEAGAKNIYLYITHCEQSIFEGEMYHSDLITHIYTTDSIFPVEKQTSKITLVG